ncbi:MAG TPA: GDCCVxC domain-containing (seleno)protein [Candidatus Hydrogenedentes bacterium]|nr:GDCCVxC domain-containing (seleno)protein [Candidatus Hydrogenedentota bacterium]
MNMPIVLESTLCCPHCGFQSVWHMPENACMWRVQCQACHRDIVTLPGKCCVFCSYGSHPSPPIQRAQHEGKGGCGCCSES